MNVSTELISGFRAPARTSTSIPDREISVRVLAMTAPFLIHSSTVGDALINRSKRSPALARLVNLPGKSLVTMSL